MHFIIFPFVAIGLLAKLKNNKYKNTLNSPILLLNKSNQKQLIRGRKHHVFTPRQELQKAGFISQD